MTGFLPPDGLIELSHRVDRTQWGGWIHRSLEAGRPTVLMLHGTGGNSATWRPLLSELGARTSGWNMVLPDLPGHGQTQCGQHAQHGLKEMAQDLQALLSSLGVQQVDLVVGHSAGAAVGIWLALLANDRDLQSGSQSSKTTPLPGNTSPLSRISIGRIIGVAPSLVPPPSLYNLLLGPVLNPLFVSAVSVSMITLLARNTGMVDRLIRSTGSQIPSSQLDAYRQLFQEENHVRGAIEFMAGTDLPELLKRGPALSAPLDLLIAEDDPWIPARALRSVAMNHFPHARLHFCKGGHLVHEADPGPLVTLMTQAFH
ncbi:MAG: alpha/beta fold hydrolase [Burkholderiaceae bacterium]